MIRRCDVGQARALGQLGLRVGYHEAESLIRVAVTGDERQRAAGGRTVTDIPPCTTHEPTCATPRGRDRTRPVEGNPSEPSSIPEFGRFGSLFTQGLQWIAAHIAKLQASLCARGRNRS
jgi:hypothetical protein